MPPLQIPNGYIPEDFDKIWFFNCGNYVVERDLRLIEHNYFYITDLAYINAL